MMRERKPEMMVSVIVDVSLGISNWKNIVTLLVFPYSHYSEREFQINE